MIAAGHSPADVWTYTPKQLDGWLHFATARKRIEAAQDLSTQAMGARGDPKEVKKRLKELTKP